MVEKVNFNGYYGCYRRRLMGIISMLACLPVENISISNAKTHLSSDLPKKKSIEQQISITPINIHKATHPPPP